MKAVVENACRRAYSRGIDQLPGLDRRLDRRDALQERLDVLHDAHVAPTEDRGQTAQQFALVDRPGGNLPDTVQAGLFGQDVLDDARTEYRQFVEPADPLPTHSQAGTVSAMSGAYWR